MQTSSDVDIERILKEAEVRLSAKQTPSGDVAATVDHAPLIRAPSITKPALVAESTSKLSVRDARPKQTQKRDDAGANWFHMPKAEQTQELKHEMQLIALRSTLAAGKQHYKKNHSKHLVPVYAQQGVLHDGGTDLIKDRKRSGQTVLKGVMENDEILGRLKRKYTDIQTVKQSGRKGWYAGVSKQRYKK